MFYIKIFLWNYLVVKKDIFINNGFVIFLHYVFIWHWLAKLIERINLNSNQKPWEVWNSDKISLLEAIELNVVYDFKNLSFFVDFDSMNDLQGAI